MLGGLGQVRKIPELRKRILFTLALLAVYRLGVFVSTPGVNIESFKRQFDTQAGSLFGMINMFSGGSFEQFSIFTLGILPYISVSIIIQILTPAIPTLQALKKEGESGRRILTKYTRQGTIVLALFQSLVIARGLEAAGMVIQPGWTFRILAMMTLTAGTAFIMWLGEQITEKGIGNGISIIIFAGIVAAMPQTLVGTLELARNGDIAPLAVLGILFFCLASIAAIVYVERSYRKIPLQYPKRAVSGKALKEQAPQQQFLPLKVNMAGVIPPIFASAALIVPAQIASFSSSEVVQDLMPYLNPGHPVYYTIFIVLIILFCFFYTPIIFNPEEVAENLKKTGGFIPTVRPGKPTADYLFGVLTRLTFWGSIYIAAVCVIPQIFYFGMGAQAFAFVFGGTAVLIVISVTLDTASQIESHVVAQNYESFMSKTASKKNMAALSYARARMLRR